MLTTCSVTQITLTLLLLLLLLLSSSLLLKTEKNHTTSPKCQCAADYISLICPDTIGSGGICAKFGDCLFSSMLLQSAPHIYH